ncbi:MAG TPA: LptA/OstA family protein [Opitutaceae bacterium]
MNFPRILFLVVGLATLLGLHAATPAPVPQRTTLEADLMDMTSTDTETRVICTGNVVLTGTNLRIACDRLEIIATRVGEKDAAVGTLERFKYLLATGNVRIVQDQREATCGRAEVLPLEEKVVLTGEPVLIDKSIDYVGAGETITLLRGQRQVIVEKPKFEGPEIKDLGANAKDAATPATPAP